jgi:hypothetical protein
MSDTDGADAAQLAVVEEEILRLIGEPRCTERSDCHAIAFGAKPCGGPRKYLIYSTDTVDARGLEPLVDAYNRRDAILNAHRDLLSDCMIVGEPTLDCVDGLCVALSGAP